MVWAFEVEAEVALILFGVVVLPTRLLLVVPEPQAGETQIPIKFVA